MTLPRPLALVFALFAGLLLAFFPFILFTMGLEGDFLAFYTSGHVLWQGELLRLYDAGLFLERQQVWVSSVSRAYRYVYLPAFISYYLPFSALPLLIARMGGGVLGVVLLGCAMRLSRAWHSLSWGTMLLLVLAFPGTYATFVVVQNSTLTLVLMGMITLWMAIRPRPLLAGMAAGFLLYKPQLLVGLAVVWTIQRKWRELTVWALMGLGWLGLSWLIAPTVTLTYFGLGQQLLGSLAEITDANASVYAAGADVLPPTLALGIAVVVALLVISTLAWVWWRYPNSSFRLPLLWLSVFLIPPYIANYDLLLLLLPLSLLVPLLLHYRGLQIATALVWMGPAITLVAPTIRWVPFALLLLYGMCGWYAIRSGERRNGSKRSR